MFGRYREHACYSRAQGLLVRLLHRSCPTSDMCAAGGGANVISENVRGPGKKCSILIVPLELLVLSKASNLLSLLWFKWL